MSWKQFIPLITLPFAFLGTMKATEKTSGVSIAEQKRMKEKEEEKEEDIERKKIEENRKQNIEYLTFCWSKIEEIEKKVIEPSFLRTSYRS